FAGPCLFRLQNPLAALMSFAPSTATKTALVQALQAVIDPLTGRDWVSTRQLQTLTVRDEAGGGRHVNLAIALAYPAKSLWSSLHALIEPALLGVDGITQVSVDWSL